MAAVWIDESDVTQLAQRLRVGPRELMRAAGGPWRVASRDEDDEIARPGTLFVGRAGPSVALLLDDATAPAVTAGIATGHWVDAGTLVWSLRPTSQLRTPRVDAPAAEVDAFVRSLGIAVDEAAAASAPDLVVCRYCGGLVGPEFALDDACCLSCGSTVLDVR